MKALRFVGGTMVAIGGALVFLTLALVSGDKPSPIPLDFGQMLFIGTPLVMFGFGLYTLGARQRCAHCAEMMDFRAAVCPHCHREVSEPKPVEWPVY